jgi:uncharacterized membrane protein
MRFRNWFIIVGGLLTILVMLIADPQTALITELPIGAGAIATLVVLVKAILYVGLLHFSRRALLDYIDMESFFRKAMLTPEGSGQALIAMGLIMIAIAGVIIASQL